MRIGARPASTVADVLTEAGWSVVIFEKGRNHLIDLADPRHSPHRLFQRRDQVRQPSLPRSGPSDRAEDVPHRRGTGRPQPRRRGEHDPFDRRRRRGARRRQDPAVQRGGLPSPVRARPPEGRGRRGLAPRLRRARAVLREGRKEHRCRGARRREPVRSMEVGSLSDAPGCAHVRRHALGCGRRAARVPPVSRADGRQLGSLRRQAGVQQLRILRILRLPDPREGRPGRDAAAGSSDRAGRAPPRDASSRGSAGTATG